ncbi:MAG: hypothetical protein AAF519_02265 [Bacteroidota bacterium]
MDKLELIDAYLRDEMDSSQKGAFEKQMASDPKLQGEFEFQKSVVAGISEARKMELKAMLDNVVISGGATENFTLGKVVAGLLVVGALSWCGYYFTQPSQPREFMPVAQEAENPQELITPKGQKAEVEKEELQVEASSKAVEEKITIDDSEVDKDISQILPKSAKEPQINKPELLTGFEGDEDTSDSLLAPGSTSVKGEIEEISSIDVSIDNTRKKFTFHYQFKNGRLFLYGDFSSDLYEILEFNADEERALFLFYKGKFYNLNDDQERIMELKVVKNKTLLSKLDKARTGN